MKSKWRSVLVLFTVIFIGGVWIWRPARTKSLLRSYLAAPVIERERIEARLREDGGTFGKGIAWGLRTPEVREAALVLLRKPPPDGSEGPIAKIAVDLLLSEEPMEWEVAGEVFMALGERGVGALQALLWTGESHETRTRAIALLVQSGERGVDAAVRYYISLFRHGDREIRRGASLQILGLGSAATPPLVEALGDPASEVRIFAAISLGNRRDRRAVEALIGRLGETEPDLGVKAAIGDALQKTTGVRGWGHDAEFWRGWWKAERASWPPQVR